MPARSAVLPGTFDPITHGHLDIIMRGAALFEQLVVAVSENPHKNPLLPLAERLRLISELTSSRPNVKAEAFTGMTVDFVRKIGADVILRGIRTFADFEYEFQLALANRRLGGVETVFIMSSAERSFIRSTLIKEAVALGGDVTPFVPDSVRDSMYRHFGNRKASGRSYVGLAGDEAPAIGAKDPGLRGEGLE